MRFHSIHAILPLLSAASLYAAPAPIQVSTASGVKATLYGFVQLDGSWENSRAYPDPGNYAVWSQTGKAAHSGEWNLTADNTRLGLDLAGPVDSSYSLSGKLELDFYGGGTSETQPVPRLRHAYGAIAFPRLGLSILAGQTWDLIGSVNAPTLNAGVLYYAGNIGNARRPQLRATETVTLAEGTTWTIAGALVRSIGSKSPFNAASSDGGHDADIPAFEGRTALSVPSWVDGQSATVGFSGHYGEEDLLLADSSNYKTLSSWSAIAELELPLVSSVSLAGEGYFGANLDAYQGGIGQGFTVVKGAARNVEGWGGWAALRLRLGPVTANVGGGVDSVRASTVATGTGRTRNTNAFANVGYALAAASKVAIEVQRIETDWKAGASERLWRVQSTFTHGF